MFITISFGHRPDWTLRVRREEDNSSLDFSNKHTHLMHALDTETEGGFPYSIGHTGEDDQRRHCIIEGTNANVNKWTHDFTFYAYKSERPMTVPYAVGHKTYADGVKYRLVENATFAGDHGWNHDYVFYAFPGTAHGTMLISVGSSVGEAGFTSKVVAGVSAKDDMFKHDAIFKVFEEKHPGTTIPIFIGSAGEGSDRRYAVSTGCLPGWGWHKDFEYYGLLKQNVGTVPIAVGYQPKPWGGRKYRVSINKKRVDGICWDHDFVFYAYPFSESLLMEVAVGFESQYWCYRLKPDLCKLTDAYFEHEFTFFGFRSPYPGTIPVSIGKAGAEHNRTLRNRVEAGANAGNRGWEHEFTVYVYPHKKPGTIPIAVGHAEFILGGWKYRVCGNYENAGTKSWTHDFAFHAYPHPH